MLQALLCVVRSEAGGPCPHRAGGGGEAEDFFQGVLRQPAAPVWPEARLHWMSEQEGCAPAAGRPVCMDGP